MPPFVADDEENGMVMATLLDATVEADVDAEVWRINEGAEGQQGMQLTSTNLPHEFCRHFRMSRDVIRNNMHGVRDYDNYFELKRNWTGFLGFSSLQKCTAVIRCFAYGLPTDASNDYLCMSESTAVEATYRFYKGVVKLFGEKYLKTPDEADTAHLLAQGEARGFSRMLGRLDCMHWNCKNYMFSWEGMYKSGHHGVHNVILEAVEDYGIWIWHAYFGTASAVNDINVLHHSIVFAKLFDGLTPP